MHRVSKIAIERYKMRMRAVKTFPRPSASFTNNPMSFWRLFFIPNLMADKMYIYDWYIYPKATRYLWEVGSIRRISRNVAARKSITIATRIAQIASREKLPAMIENDIPADSSATFSVLLHSYTIFFFVFFYRIR